MMKTMNKVLRDYIPEITMLFWDKILVKECLEEGKGEVIVKKCK